MEQDNDERLPAETDDEEENEVIDYMAVDPEEDEAHEDNASADQTQNDPGPVDQAAAAASVRKDSERPETTDAFRTWQNF